MKKILHAYIILVVLTASGCDNSAAPKNAFKTNAEISAHIFLEEGYPGKKVTISYNGKEIWSGVPTNFAGKSKAYSAHVRLLVKKTEEGEVVIVASGVVPQMFRVDWSLGGTLVSKIKNKKISFIFPSTKKYK